MAISVYKTFSAGESLTAADLNSSLTQIVNNGTDVAFPLTKNGAAGGFILTGLGAGSADGNSVRYEQLPFSVCNFRLTLTSGTAVTTTDVTAAETVYACPTGGNAIGLYDGTNWHVRTSTEMSIDVPDATNMYDVFCYDNAGTPTLELTAWTNDTTRATALTTQNGVLVKTGATTRRYLGSFYCTTAGNGQTEDSLANRYLWNYYNRVLRPMRVVEATANWNYSTATWRQANAAAANQLNFCIGVSEDAVTAAVHGAYSNSGGAGIRGLVGIGLDSTSAFHANCMVPESVNPATGVQVGVRAELKCFPAVGKDQLSWLEFSGATATGTFYGAVASTANSGIHGEILA